MLTVYIADDEEVVRNGLKKIINWQELGFEICGEAGNGLTAYNEIREKKPDLILLDIRMPKLQGLDLAYQLREEGITGRIIILSGYSEFKYAQDAIKCDVDFYLTKPIDEEELLAAVEHIRSIVQKKKLHNEHLNYYQEKAKYKILEDMIHEERLNLASINYSLGELNLEADFYQVLLLHGNTSYKHLCQKLNVPLETNQIERLKKDDQDVLLLKGELIIRRLQQLAQEENSSSNQYYFIAVGGVVSGINDIYYSYHEALAVMERYFFFDNYKCIATKDDLPAGDQFTEKLTIKDSKKFGQNIYDEIKMHHLKESVLLIQNLHQQLTYAKNSAESIKSFLAGMYLYILNEFKKDYPHYNEEVLTNAEIIQWIHERTYLQEIIEFIEKKVHTMIECITTNQSENIIDEITEYIERHYAQDIKLKSLAPKFGYNSSYLGKIFSKQSGKSFNDYLHYIRTQKAKELLEKNEYKVYEVAEIVGYKNVDYFHLKFKSFVGVTPNEYRSTL
jgi:two-component system response regulator YesN